jgi:histidinol phosphatase-like enzyme
MHLKDWTLFLDRDGVINVHKRGGYIQNRAEFYFLPKNLEVFKKILAHKNFY